MVRPAGPGRRPRAPAGTLRTPRSDWVSAQRAAFAPAQLPAQLAAPLLQAALQPFVLLQGAERGPVQVSPSGAPGPAPLGNAPRDPPRLPARSPPHSHPLLVVQVPDQLVALVHQRHQLLQQKLLSVLLRGRFQPV